MKQNGNIKNLWELIVKEHRIRFFFLAFFMLIGMTMEVLGIGLLVPLVNLLTSNDFSQSDSILEPIFRVFAARTKTQLLLVGLFSISIVILIKNLFFVFISYYKFRLTSQIRSSIENRLFKKYLNAHYEFHLRTNSSLLVRNITSEVDQVIDNVLVPLISISVEILVVLGLTTLLMFIEPYACIALILFFGVCGLVYTKTIGPVLTKFGNERSHHRTLLLKGTNEALGGFKEIKLFSREAYFQKAFDSHTASASRLSVISSTLQSLPLLLVELWGILGLVLVVLVMLMRNSDTPAIVSVLGLFVGASFRFLPALNRILVAVNGLRHVGPSIEILHKEISEMTISNTDTRKFLHFESSIEFENVSFSYNQDSERVLDQISFTIRSGETLGILGPSGSGKSTFVDILLGLLTPTAGKVLVDGDPVDLSRSTWMNQAGYVPQEIYLLDNSIRNNIAFGLEKEYTSDSRILAVMKLAQIDEFVNSLPDGLETSIGERGSRLSGGQRQRIGIARALYNSPSLLILDEATSALDVQSESEFIESLEAIRGGLTIVMISHKVSTLKYCNRILKMQDGKLVEQI
jgi:ABC-type multidrug transport system fused ATPase/permease subunit